jgi:hypothetical protein
MTKGDKKRMNSLKRRIYKVREKRNQAMELYNEATMNKIRNLKAKQAKIIKRVKGRKR